ncbi:MAG TPA: ribonuclease PH [Candidatus Alectryocaccomicrobium excrementavium]|uniref:Multifunctional fusion protein n=1 Tax=Candidatus Alectryocaccomicrobium excrementavium TaxID=2840668 RepID=A0A9D1G225_9FIRM|nr:ribonuclease PH [Candidatus Alectryocaccomicrobium excrementavium]
MEKQLRPVRIQTDFTEMAAGSVLIECGRTRVLCTASVEDGAPPFLRGSGRGWLTAEYAMLPGSTPRRKPRDGIKKDGRGTEIQRLIGRSLRACMDFSRLGERTITVDCDVLQADGGTRTASITGGFVAVCLAVNRLIQQGVLFDSPIVRQIAAVSVGIVEDELTLDLDYARDSRAQVDMNVIMARDARGEMQFVEVQGTGEGRPFAKDELDGLLALAQGGIEELMREQRAALGERADVLFRKPRLVLASQNAGKLRELRALFGAEYDVASMGEMGLDMEIEETGSTFEENARIKAEALCARTGCAALADDSGLEVDCLGGAPGVYSARYAGGHGDDAANNALLIANVKAFPAPRTARFVSAVALARPGRETLVARGSCEGEVLLEERGEGGFGYDPLFYSHDLHKTFAEASAGEKNTVSHRARALKKLVEIMRNS